MKNKDYGITFCCLEKQDPGSIEFLKKKPLVVIGMRRIISCG
jgi:hypothetical protein